MLVSKTKQGEWFNLASYQNLELLRELRKSECFYCPECNERVLLKVGTIKIPHFAHEKGAVCSENYERESEYHLKGKLALYKWLQQQSLSPLLEPYFKEIAQRPDIGFTHNGVSYALEYQCSTIPEELFVKRTENYYKANIIPIWIIAGKNIKRKGHNRVALTRFDYLFVTKKSSGTWFLPAYCPITDSLILIHEILPVTVKNSLAQFSVVNLKSSTISNILNPGNSRSNRLEDWIKEIRKAKNISLPLYGSVHNKFLQELYSHSLAPSMLPPEIGLPVPHLHFIETPAIEWQSYLFIDVLKHNKLISMEQIFQSFRKRVRNRKIKIRQLPQAPMGNALMAVREYIDLLIQIKIIQPISQTSFKMVNPAIKHDTLGNQLEYEKIFYQTYGEVISKSLRWV
ncbi:competence protein CoiA family protein [Bacillus sp. DTU_2020_1000418_1_SI_GHA_SEK_038]|uniref:competence protein CoiA n=1 Tax=Bacillus sp. DTU_2020_1000418_1_SI_GHA_SEK_038 TaxID=3077585 RepID=UPI0028ED7CF3|nr:competence protein CoiA family protein [Bacillus sp. DTU_2020_1000418_1_SI_GHA_SEK_038]WNS76876.1 competence protein CoiA family protein [Bacillus sp. DTU_2020_1000418_1_SI_GHA_SEK_038]